jgi:deazaflavin-dependent oxidoreductase (nitroreductase family)
MTEKPDTSMNARIIEEFRANAGKAGPWERGNLLLLHTTGAKSGEPRLNPVGCFRIGDKMLIVGSYAGADVSPPWVHNLRAHPRAHIETGTESYDVIARELPRGERDAAYAEIAKAAPTFAEYETKTSRVIPVFELRRA